MYSKLKYIFALIAIIFLLSFTKVSAHSGRTDSSGGHNCRTGSCAGTYHYHNGGSAYTPPVRTPTLTVAGSEPTKKSVVNVTAPTPVPTPSPTMEPVISETHKEAVKTIKLVEDEQYTIEQDQSSFWDTVFSDNVLLTIARLLIFKF